MSDSAIPDRLIQNLIRTQDPKAGSSPRIWTSAELLAGRQEALIHHEGKIYRLRSTKNGKLILTK